MRDAFEPLAADGMVFFVLTLDRYGTYSGEKRWKTSQDAYRDLSALTTRFLRLLRNWMAANGWKPLANQWVATVEAHQSGWPHMNIVCWSPELANWISQEKQAKLLDGFSGRESNLVSGELADIVTESGFGLISSAERANGRDESLGYICKLAGKVEESIGELAKLSQIPSNAPFRFRRIRSGKSFLPKRKKNEDVTGTLVRRSYLHGAGYEVLPLHNVKGDSVAHNEYCCSLEETIWQDELEKEVRLKKKVFKYGHSICEIPPVTKWVNGARLAYVAAPHRSNNGEDYIFGSDEVLRQRLA